MVFCEQPDVSSWRFDVIKILVFLQIRKIFHGQLSLQFGRISYAVFVTVKHDLVWMINFYFIHLFFCIVW